MPEQCQALLFSHSAPSHLSAKLGGDTARTADQRDIPHCITPGFAVKTGLEGQLWGDRDFTSKVAAAQTGWAVVCFCEVVSDCLCTVCSPPAPLSFTIFFHFCYCCSLSCCTGGDEEGAVGSWLLGQHQHLTFFLNVSIIAAPLTR